MFEQCVTRLILNCRLMPRRPEALSRVREVAVLGTGKRELPCARCCPCGEGIIVGQRSLSAAGPAGGMEGLQARKRDRKTTGQVVALETLEGHGHSSWIKGTIWPL
jgi:hypothetical protein